ncbi:YukJ family protein, partial [Bacillus sp. EE-W1]|uniref:YukJ family protein n=1 Tax=Bacillus sp. EE-W1 TaxID=2662453 RepID=UPI0012FB133B
PSEVLYFASDDFNSEEITHLPGLQEGFTRIRNNNPEIGIDFIRGKLFDSKQMIPLPNQEVGPDNDLYDKLNNYIQKAKDKQANIYAFGDIWENEPKEDKYFGFYPGNGIHDIHMNQGNLKRWQGDDGIWQDGALLIHFENKDNESKDKWVGIFLAFQSQSWCTDEQGHA